jgi:hypothetical protein
MNNETLKSDLCARLMDGVKVEVLDYKSDYVGNKIDEIIGITQWSKCGELWSIETKGGAKPSFERIKPILFPTSAITKEIKIANYNDGKPFVPIKEMMLEQYKNQSVKVLYHSYENRISIIIKCLKTNEIEQEFDLYRNNWFNYPQWIIEFFHKTHINYRLSPEQFIEATNEYE